MTDHSINPFDIVKENIALLNDDDFFEAEVLFSKEHSKRKEGILRKGQRELLQMASKYGIEIDIKTQITQEKIRKPIGRAEAKYRNPDNADQTWSGRGLKPKWLNEKLVAGATLEEMLIQHTES